MQQSAGEILHFIFILPQKAVGAIQHDASLCLLELRLLGVDQLLCVLHGLELTQTIGLLLGSLCFECVVPLRISRLRPCVQLGSSRGRLVALRVVQRGQPVVVAQLARAHQHRLIHITEDNNTKSHMQATRDEHDELRSPACCWLAEGCGESGVLGLTVVWVVSATGVVVPRVAWCRKGGECACESSEGQAVGDRQEQGGLGWAGLGWAARESAVVRCGSIVRRK